MKKIKYKKGYKYQLDEDYKDKVDILSDKDCFSEYITLEKNGSLIIHRGYAWDGCSGPTVDTKSNMRAGLVHDALYQLCREGLLSVESRKQIDGEFKKRLKEDGMNSVRRWTFYNAVRKFASFAVNPENKKKILMAP